MRTFASMAAAGLLLGFGRAGGAADAVPACSDQDLTRWRLARATSLGLSVTDRSPILIPEVVASSGAPADASCPAEVDFASDQDGRASDGLHDWVYAAPCKVTACGEPQSFEQNRGLFWFSGEYDLNNNIAVEADFRARHLRKYLCYDPESKTAAADALLALQEPRLCFPPTESLHAEITPPPRLRPLLRKSWTDNWPYGWLRWRESLALTLPALAPAPGEGPGGTSAREERKPVPRICAFGPFVADTGHAARAEIHPLQVLWWKEGQGPEGSPAPVPRPDDETAAVGPFALFVMQDASARYTKPHHFVLSEAPPAGSTWRPWAEAPVEGIFTVPFWSDPQDPPRFRLDPYDYLGTDGGAPASVACNEAEVTALAGGPMDQRLTEETVASVCKAVAAEPPSRIQVEVRPDCYCDPAARPEAACPGNRRGYLGRLVIQAETGRRRDWSEGSLALRLFDQRSRREASGQAAALASAGPEAVRKTAQDRAERQRKAIESLERPREASGIVTWKPSAGAGWERVVPKGEAIASLPSTLDRLFAEAGWPPEARRPLPSLWRLRSADLHADAVVEDLAEKHRKSKKVHAEFLAPLAIPLLASPQSGGGEGPSRRLPAPRRLGEESARLELPGSEGEAPEGQALFRIEAPVEIDVKYKDRQGRDQHKPALPPDFAERKQEVGQWTLWSHGLGAEPFDDWMAGVRALCDRDIAARHREKEQERQESLRRRSREGSGGAAAPQAEGPPTPVTPPVDDLRTIVRRATKDGVVSVTELKLVVRAVKGLCRGSDDDSPGPRATQVQSK